MRSRHAPPDAVLTTAAAESVRRGHPWVWSKGLERAPSAPAGAEVVLRSSRDDLLGRGVFDPSSPIAVRVWTHDGADALDETHLRRKLARAFGARRAVLDLGATNAYRMLHGEGDRVPGFVIDRYGDLAVIRLDGAAAEAIASRMQGTLLDALAADGASVIAVRRAEKGAAPVFELWRGELPRTVTVREHGVPFVVDVAKGQKTGAFLDQRENRRRVGAMARDKRVLNLFSYAGGFSLHAALGGARRVTSVDIASQAHATAQASFRAAGVDPKGHDFVTADVFAYLAGAASRGDTWDLVISDPPSFAPSEKSRERALTAYRALHKAAVGVLAPGGVFCAASCSSHVDEAAFLTTLDDAATAPRGLSLLEVHGQPPDHPTLAGWPEGRYLKFAVLS